LKNSGLKEKSKTQNGLVQKIVLEKSRRTAIGSQQKVIVEILLSDTAIESEDPTFQRAYLKALEEADIIAYDGHSGLGANLGSDYLDDFSLGKQYQILFLNGCSSYPYFNAGYFNSKTGGSLNLEIITSGLSTLTSTSLPNMQAFLEPFIAGKTVSYQTLLRNIEASNGEEETYLMGVNGDEDNEFRPLPR
jgi:hypothetical protein